MVADLPTTKPVQWVASSRKDLRAFPAEVRREVGLALLFAQVGEKHPSAKPLSGFGGAATLEIVEDDDGNTYRVVYTVKFQGVVYVLHAFQKKSKRGIATPKHDIDLIRERLKLAEQMHAQTTKETG
jgi:phage-related protein